MCKACQQQQEQRPPGAGGRHGATQPRPEDGGCAGGEAGGRARPPTREAPQLRRRHGEGGREKEGRAGSVSRDGREQSGRPGGDGAPGAAGVKKASSRPARSAVALAAWEPVRA